MTNGPPHPPVLSPKVHPIMEPMTRNAANGQSAHTDAPREPQKTGEQAEIDAEIKSKRTCHLLCTGPLWGDICSSLPIHTGRRRWITRRRSNLEHKFPIERTLGIPMEREGAVYRGTYLVRTSPGREVLAPRNRCLPTKTGPDECGRRFGRNATRAGRRDAGELVSARASFACMLRGARVVVAVITRCSSTDGAEEMRM
jgi:hypothetical protein